MTLAPASARRYYWTRYKKLDEPTPRYQRWVVLDSWSGHAAISWHSRRLDAQRKAHELNERSRVRAEGWPA